MTTTRPELGPITEGTDVFVLVRGVRVYEPPIPATVTKANRVWLTIVATDDGHRWPREWRMRRDTQDTDADVGWRDRFVTPAQLAYEEREDAARTFLSDQGIDIAYRSPWKGRLGDLADLIRAAVTEGNPS